MSEREFKNGDIVRITAIGPYNGCKAKVLDEVIGSDKSYTVWFNYDTPEPYMKVFAEEHLELIEPAEEKKNVELRKNAEKHPYRAAVEKLLDRQEEKGISKYGVTLDKNVTLTGTQRIEHLEEELIDALMYCEHLKAGISGSALTADDYQRAALRTAQTDKFSPDDLLQNGVMGLCGEAGEVIDIVKKVMFQGHELSRKDIRDELGDVAWYWSLACYALGFKASEVLEANIEKLKDRYKDGFSKERSINRKEYKSEEGTPEEVSHDLSD